MRSLSRIPAAGTDSSLSSVAAGACRCSVRVVFRPRAHRPLIAVAAFAAWAAASVAGGPTTSVVWENLDGANTPIEAAVRDADGTTLLSAGSAGAGDGAIVALGYFTGATPAAPFAGTWIPLTGPQAANIPFQRTAVGDATDGSVPDGFFTFQTDFDAENSAVYQHVPADGTQLAIAIYNRSTIGASTRFNIATNDAWRWDAPDPVLPTFLFLNLNSPGTVWFGGTGTEKRTALATSGFPGNAARAPARLINISTRGFVSTGDAVMIPGFVLNGTGHIDVLARAVGPTLGEAFGLGGVLADPELRLVRQSDGQTMGENDDWTSQPDPASVAAAISTLGAMPELPNASLDAAVVRDLSVSPGGYTVLVGGKNGGTGLALTEIYLTDLSPTASAELVNISTRGYVGTGDNIMISGFVLGPGGPRRLLIRAAGPSWGPPIGLDGTLLNPRLRVVASAAPETILAQNEDWEDDGQDAAIAAAAQQAGAFAFSSGKADAALILELAGSTAESRGFTVQVSGSPGATGLVLTEIYALP